ncbi:hypothetical protein, partial [Gordonia aichiensis]|uniref:hypothetical protein n=1 Tax=Gordonia aichiensis TaxID=36820 RepID=UPI001C3F2E59
MRPKRYVTSALRSNGVGHGRRAAAMTDQWLLRRRLDFPVDHGAVPREALRQRRFGVGLRHPRLCAASRRDAGR